MSILFRAIRRMGWALSWLGAMAAWSPLEAADWPPLVEVVSRLRAEVPEVAEPASQAMGVEEYLRGLAPRVLGGVPEASETPELLRSHVYQHSVGVAYLRVGEVREGLRAVLATALEGWTRTNEFSGVVLDLRFAGGTNFVAAVEAAGLFVNRKPKALRLGESTLQVEPESGSRKMPVMVLVNRQTRGAAEVLAVAVRDGASPCLVIGTNTAGQAREYRTLELPGGRTLRVASTPLLLGSGEPFPLSGLEPELGVTVSELDERAYRVDEFQRSVDGRPAGRGPTLRMNEAELVRRRQAREDAEGFGRRGMGPRGPRRPGFSRVEPSPVEEPPPVVEDPVLARALDLIAGTASSAGPAAAPSGNGAEGEKR